MNSSIYFQESQASEIDIQKHLISCDDSFIPKLSSKVSIVNYAQKIKSNAITFEAWMNNELIGLVAAYINHPPSAFITSVSIKNNYQKRGIANQLINNCKIYALTNGCSEIFLEVSSLNSSAITLYKKHDFKSYLVDGELTKMKLVT